jgi:hypothetical protein
VHNEGEKGKKKIRFEIKIVYVGLAGLKTLPFLLLSFSFLNIKIDY